MKIMKIKAFSMGVLLGAAFLSLNGCIFGSSEKDAEQVEDPLKKTEYYITGVVANSNGALANVNVKVNDTKVTTGSDGTYLLTVDNTGTYSVTFTASGQEDYTTSVTIASSATNRSMLTLNVTMAKVATYTTPVTISTTTNTTVNVPASGGSGSVTATVDVPAGSTDAGTTISVASVETASAATSNTPQGNSTAEPSLSTVSIKTDPSTAKTTKDITLGLANPGSSTIYFDPTAMVVMKSATTKASSDDSGNVTYSNGHYEYIIPAGSTISGQYSTLIKADKTVSATVKGDANSVNGKSSVTVDNSKNLSAIKDYELNILAKAGWSYTTSPSAAATAVGANDANLIAIIQKFIEKEEGKEGEYTVSRSLKTNISGNSIMFYQNFALYCTKTYTFKLKVNGMQKNIVVALKCYTGNKENYTNTTANEHSGGGTGGY